jgi:PKD repeat protein
LIKQKLFEMKKLGRILTLLSGFILLMGCSSDEKEAGVAMDTLDADFSFTNDGSTFTFTNLSEDATTYRWDFGDLGFISNEENPTHTYSIGGELVVSLTITDENGETGFVTKTIDAPEIIVIDIAIDGDFDDWEHVEPLAENDPAGGAIHLMKVWTVGENMNFYLEGSSAMELELVQIYMDTDGNPGTGFLADDWPDVSGAEVMFEGPFVNDSWGNFFQQGEGTGWAFDDVVEGSAVSDINISAVTPIGGDKLAVEFSIKKSILGSLGENFGVGVLELNSSWSTVSVFPDSGSFAQIEL